LRLSNKPKNDNKEGWRQIIAEERMEEGRWRGRLEIIKQA